MRPQDIVILLKVLCYGSRNWYHKDLANDLCLSTAEVSNSLQRSASSGLIDTDKKKVRTQSLLEFLIYGIQYVFTQRPNNISRGIPTAHSHPFMKALFSSDQTYVWPDAESDDKGLSVQPLYPGVVSAAKKDEKLYLMLALVDVLRMGKTREKEIAITKLKELLEQ
jgi:hypothetical protein